LERSIHPWSPCARTRHEALAAWKIELIETKNPDWGDLTNELSF
jgi:hypothetical protein